MGPGNDIYRAILEYDHQPMKQVINPHYDPNYTSAQYDRNTQPWLKRTMVPDGPVEVKETMIGPYIQIAPIKAYVTRNRGRHNSKNLRIKRIERVTAWEEVVI
jgi:hypothetical protein